MSQPAGSSIDTASPDRLISEAALARRWDLSQRTLQRWRADGLGPAHIRIGTRIRYRFADVLDYETCHRSEEGEV